METTTLLDSELQDFKRLEEYRKGREHVFASSHSLTWFVRHNRAQLIDAGALVQLTGQWHARSSVFDQYVLEAGQRAARHQLQQPNGGVRWC